MTAQIREHKKIIPIALVRVLEKMTDFKHVLSMSDLQSQVLDQFGISVDRRTVYATVRMLNEFGYDIRYGKANIASPEKGYYLATREYSEEDVIKVLLGLQDIRKKDAFGYEKIKHAMLLHFSTFQVTNIEDALEAALER